MSIDSKGTMLGTLNSLTSIVAIDLRGAIGCRNELPWRLKTDMRFFRETTTGKTVLMGRKTYDSIGGCLAKRDNVVLSHNNVLFDSTEHCQLALSIDEALYRAAVFCKEDAYVIGGAVTYKQFAPLVDRYLVTIVDHQVADADAFLSSSILAALRSWDRKELESHPALEGRDDFPFTVYEITAPDVEERRKARGERISKYQERIQKAPSPKRSRPATPKASQDAFAF